MSGRPGVGKARARGNIEELASGALRVRVYAGIDPVTKKRHTLIEVIPSGPKAWREAEAARERLLREVAERRNPRTSATVNQLLDRYLEQFAGAPNTLDLYRTHVRNHISPCLGHLRVGQLDAETRRVLRRTASMPGPLQRSPHDRPPGPGRARMRRHLSAPHMQTARPDDDPAHPLPPLRRLQEGGPVEMGEREPHRAGRAAARAEAQPPATDRGRGGTDHQRVVARSRGALVWTAMTTGMRRGELCAVRVSSVDLTPGRETVWLRTAIRRDPDVGWAEGDLKTHQQRRIALDDETAAILRDQISRCRARASVLGFELPSEAFLFSGALDGASFPTPDSVTQRYDRMVTRLGIETTQHKLRHYSATELIASGVDPRTVAGRLGHGGGGTTTLKTYTAWVSEADQRAAKGLGAGMPQRPADIDPVARARQEPRYPYEVVAAGISRHIEEGTLTPADEVPSAAELAATYGVSLATAKRGLVLAQDWGLLARTGRNHMRVATQGTSTTAPVAPASPVATAVSSGVVLLDLVLRRRGAEIARFTSAADPHSDEHLQKLLLDAVIRRDGDIATLPEYEMDVHAAGHPETFDDLRSLRLDVNLRRD